MLADFLAQVLHFAPWGFLAGLCFLLAGLIGVIVYRRREVTMGPVPRKLAAPPAVVLPHVDFDTGVVPRIPGATPAAGPTCPVCGGAWHGPVCPPPEERTEEAGETLPVKAADMAPQFAALDRFFKAVDEARADTDQAMHRIVDTLAGRDHDCPLTTQEIPPLDPALPMHDATVRASDTRDLTLDIAKILEARNA